MNKPIKKVISRFQKTTLMLAFIYEPDALQLFCRPQFQNYLSALQLNVLFL